MFSQIAVGTRQRHPSIPGLSFQLTLRSNLSHRRYCLPPETTGADMKRIVLILAAAVIAVGMSSPSFADGSGGGMGGSEQAGPKEHPKSKKHKKKCKSCQSSELQQVIVFS